MDISTKAMLVSLKITQWTCSKKDKEVTEDVLLQHQAQRGTGSFSKKLLAKEQMQNIRQIAGAARNRHYELTLPWSQDGARILPAAMFPTYDQELRQMKGEFEVAVREFVQNYPDYVDDARLRLGGLFKSEDYPQASEIEGKFSWELIVAPLPSGNDFRVGLSKEMTDAIRQEIEARTLQQVEAGAKDVWQRTFKVVEHMAKSLEDYSVVKDDDGKEKTLNPFRDSLVENVREIAKLLPALNVTGDANLTRMASEITAKLTLRDPKDLRTDKKVRKTQAKDARKILEEMSEMMGG